MPNEFLKRYRTNKVLLFCWGENGANRMSDRERNRRMQVRDNESNASEDKNEDENSIVVEITIQTLQEI
jgi:hypothetical protein